jgi:ubiquitin-protein ligase
VEPNHAQDKQPESDFIPYTCRMKKAFPILLVLFAFGLRTFAQINFEDSTIAVIGYWDKNEKQTYAITQEKIKITGSDTTIVENLQYDVDIMIQDSTEKSYTIIWKYKNFKTDTDNKFTKSLMSVTDNLDVIIKTDENGSVLEVVNWKEIRNYISTCIDKLKADFKDVPKINEICDQVEKVFSSKESIESAAIKDIIQLYTFNGAKYTLHEVLNGKQKLPNLYGGDPFDADFEIELTDLDTSDNTGLIRYVLTVDHQQITDAAYNYMKKIAKAVDGKVPDRKDMPEITFEDRTASSIHGPSGWVLYSINVREVMADNVTSIDKRIIELK